MRKIRAFIFCASILLLITSQCAFAQSDSTKKCFQAEDKGEHNFGKIEQNNSVEHTFLIHNTCSDTVFIENAKASCGCTAAIVSEKVIAPGEAAKIQVKFTPPRGTHGSVSKTVSVYLKGQTQPHTVLRFSADVRAELDVQPGTVAFNAPEIGKVATAKATVKNISEGDVEIVETTISISSFADTLGNSKMMSIPLKNAKVSIDKKKLKQNESAEILVECTPMYVGRLFGSVLMKTKKGDATLQLTGEIKAPGEVKEMKALPVKDQVVPPLKEKKAPPPPVKK
jgi:hypothetical protein